ncbi:retinol-DH_like_SDR_c domain-containing protein isoform X2 [Ictalurus furcatus]|uniref:retinol-DH_like_SDR_c domain-containing protein isoform X2 n=2 Tax=Ictalurus furcatus TaxID=66913 RepID=UPI00234FC89E|nr:retinol-DH_like_SDR_c domain-containing protein isoform X2 [Ictalurus furcatus]
MNLYIAVSHLWEEMTLNHLAKYGVITAATVISLAVLRKWIAGGVCYSCVRLDGRTVVITGANTGIGKETAHDMAKRGARVVMACRDLSRAEKAAEEIRCSTGNGNVVVRHLDLASFFSVRQFAQEYIATEDRLDILINNAGVMMCPHSLTVDGYETQFAVNHLGHFLLTVLLLDMLKTSAPSRVVNVSSIAHKGGKIHFNDLNFTKTPYDSLISYRQSKLANMLFTRELARRTKGSGVTVYALHPGVIHTELGRYVQTRHPVLSTLLIIPALLLMKTPKQGAQTSIYCAVAEGLENYSGCYFSDCQLKEPPLEAKDDLAAVKLWDVSSQLVGYKEED